MPSPRADDDIWASSEEDEEDREAALAARARIAILKKFKVKAEEIVEAEQEDVKPQSTRKRKQQSTDVTALDKKSKKQKKSNASAVEPGMEKKEDEFDMFSDSVAEMAVHDSKRDRGDGHGEVTNETSGYYNVRLGDKLGRYECLSDQGQGVFSTVVRCRDLQSSGNEYAVKVIRKNPVLEAAGLREISFLKQLTATDPSGKRHIVKYIDDFWHHDHLCIVLESMKHNLRQLVSSLGGRGISLEWVQLYAKQLLFALKHCKSQKIIHADIKPDNLLVSEDSRTVKLCDLGSALKSTDSNDVTPLLVSRWYRAPEIILGLPYDEQLDVFSLGAVLFELYTGQVLFHGESNNDMLFRIQELHGPVPKKMLRTAAFREEHFSNMFEFQRITSDPLTQQDVLRSVSFPPSGKPEKLFARMASADPDNFKKMSKEKQKLVLAFKDFVLQCTRVDPAVRLSCDAAFSHPFITN